DNDAEGVWSPDIEQSFQEALAIYPPCGRRKIILSDEGKMYGRNELIARYIKLRTGKTRTRKQVSSHIQVLARKKVREYQVGIKVSSHLQVLARRKSREIQSKLKVRARFPAWPLTTNALRSLVCCFLSFGWLFFSFPPPFAPGTRWFCSGIALGCPEESAAGRAGRGARSPFLSLRAVKFGGKTPLFAQTWTQPRGRGGLNLPRRCTSAALLLWASQASPRRKRTQPSAASTYSKHLFVHIGQTNPSYSDPLLEAVDIRQIYDKFPEKKGGLKELYERGPQNSFFLVKFWADLNSTIQDGPGTFYGVSSQYSSAENMTITVSTKVCSFGKQVVEKVETEYARLENGRFVYRIHRSPMCEYMINFIHKLKHLPEKYMMNSVLENFTILQVVTNRDTQETLLCIAFVFEVSTSEHGAQHHVYKLVKD
ncbi:TEAD3 factor, partial [Asarcornis scutulata]|nr:TEAD3 factor [Asarcornis scutulata]